MWDINKTIRDITAPSGHVSILLNSNTTLHYQRITYPITWSGFVDNHPVEILQKSSMSSFAEGYEFRVYPDGYSIYEDQIIKLIDNCLRRALD